MDVSFANLFLMPVMILFCGDWCLLCQPLFFACYDSVWRLLTQVMPFFFACYDIFSMVIDVS